MVEQMPRGGTAVESTEPSISERASQRYILSFLSAFRVLHRKSMRAKQEVSDESMRRIIETIPSNADGRGTGSFSDVCTEIGNEENEEEEEEEVAEGEILRSESMVDVAPETARQKAHGRRDKKRSSVANCSAISVTQVETDANDVLCGREKNLIVKIKGTAEPNGVDATAGDDESPLVNHNATLRNESLFISSGYVGSLQAVWTIT
jgi:type IV secretory pathway VirJ component